MCLCTFCANVFESGARTEQSPAPLSLVTRTSHRIVHVCGRGTGGGEIGTYKRICEQQNPIVGHIVVGLQVVIASQCRLSQWGKWEGVGVAVPGDNRGNTVNSLALVPLAASKMGHGEKDEC